MTMNKENTYYIDISSDSTEPSRQVSDSSKTPSSAISTIINNLTKFEILIVCNIANIIITIILFIYK